MKFPSELVFSEAVLFVRIVWGGGVSEGGSPIAGFSSSCLSLSPFTSFTIQIHPQIKKSRSVRYIYSLTFSLSYLVYPL